MKEALEVERLSLKELCERNLEGGFFYWRPWRMRKGRLWRQTSLYGPCWGTWKGDHIPGMLKDERRRALGMGYLYEGNLEGGLLYW